MSEGKAESNVGRNQRRRIYAAIRKQLRELLGILTGLYPRKESHLFALVKKGQRGHRLFARGSIDGDDGRDYWAFFDRQGPTDITLWAQENAIQNPSQIRIIYPYSNLRLRL